jgi:IS1 family transposase
VNVRCGILHNAETRNGWKILRDGPFYDVNTKTINAVKFMNRLKSTLKDYKKALDNSVVNTEIWNSFVNRLKDVISKA